MASAVAKRKGKRKEEKNKSLKDVEQAMNKINFGDNVSGENTSEGMVDTYFSYMAKMISNLPEGVRKQRLMMQLEEEKIAATESMVAFKKQLVARVGGVQKMRFDEGDQSPLVGEDATYMQDQLDHLGLALHLVRLHHLFPTIQADLLVRAVLEAHLHLDLQLLLESP